jgi:hypothetical protein
MPDFATGQPGITELWLHYLWKEKKFSLVPLRADNNLNLEIITPGWYNRGWGPDFKDGRILIGDDELFGDIEIHIDEDAWDKHGHNLDDAYNRVVLHVYLNKANYEVRNKLGQPLPSLDLNRPGFSEFWKKHIPPTKISIKELPGVCGLYLGQTNYQKVRNIIFQASEQRLLSKSESFAGHFSSSSLTELENQLFASICRSTGYSAFSNDFYKIAHLYPYSELRKFFRKTHRECKSEILSRWFGYLGILGIYRPEEIASDLRREWSAMKQLWQQNTHSHNSIAVQVKTPSRPLNNPVRRLTGLYYHLEKIHFQGLLKSWLKFLQDCGKLLNSKQRGFANIQKLLDKLFPQPDWDPLNYLISPNSKAVKTQANRLIGKQRQFIILVNAILPFFLSWARHHHDKSLEKTLFALFLALPGEGRNSKTNFMEQRLINLHPNFKIKKNLSYYQGLIQLHDDCCRNFYEGCRNCSLIKMIRQRKI